MPLVAAWLDNAEATRSIMKSRYAHLTDEQLLEVLVQPYANECDAARLSGPRRVPCGSAGSRAAA